MRLDQRRQLVHHVVVHAVVRGPGLLRGVQVEACAQAEVPGAVGIAGDTVAARAGIRRHQYQSQFGGDPLGAGLLHEVLVGTGQPGQPVQGRQRRLRLGLGRQVDGEDHLAVQGPGKMTVTLVPAAEGLLAADQFEGILHVTSVKRSWRAAGPAATACQ